jgi:hypothetical protein
MQTPTPSEIEEFEDAYVTAWWFWVEVSTRKVPESRYRKTAEWLDSLPGVSEYFRALCHFELEEHEHFYTIRRA